MEGKQEVGRVTHFYPKVSVAVVELKAPLSVGDRITVAGKTTNFEQVVESMEIEHKSIQKASVGQSIGLKVTSRVREEDIIYR